MKTHPQLEALVSRVASRHDRTLARKLVFLTLATSAAVCVLGALLWVLRGHSVPVAWPLSVLVVGMMTGFGLWKWRRMDRAAAIRETDRFFGLKDGVASALHLEKAAPPEAVAQLQWEWLEPRLGECRVEHIPAPFPKRSAWLSLPLLGAAVWMCLLPPSPEVLAAEKEARETQERIAEAKDQLEQLIEEMEKDLVAPEDQEIAKMDEFRKMVKTIDEHGDRAEAARQFARIEQKVRDAANQLDQKRDEETLKLAAAELAKAEETEARQLGKKLDAKELKEAAEQLEKMAGKKLDPKELKDAEKRKEKLSEAKKELAKMRAVSKRLSAAGKQRQGARQAQGAQGSGQGQGQGNADGKAGEMAEGKDQAGKALEDQLAELDEAAAEMEKNLEEVELDPNAELSDEPMEKANERLKGLGKHLKGMQGRRLAKGKLDQLRNGLAQAQAFAQGQSQMLGLAQPGGKQAGVGSSWSERKERDDSQKNGQLAELKGQHGQGPSLSSVEDAESGTGTSTRKGEAKQREFARQVESFVQRDDVPESLKLGVRNYFEGLQSTPAKPEEGGDSK